MEEYQKIKIRELRSKGFTYSEINKRLNLTISKSSLSYICKDVRLPNYYQEKISKFNLLNAKKAREIALMVNREKYKSYLKSIRDKNKNLSLYLKNKDTAKIALTMLYLGEGSKTTKSLVFGCSDPDIIRLYLKLLRFCYDIDEEKFRCTLQCRADQNTHELEIFWSGLSKIPLKQFYKARVDPRTIGKITNNLQYKGVCRIDYFSSEIFYEMMIIPKILNK